VKRLARADEGHVADVHDDVELSFPQSAADLGELIEKRWGWKIPDVAVCEGHTAPLAALYEAFSEAARALLWVAPRGGSKTALCALLIMLDSLFRPGKEAVTVAATEAQAGRHGDAPAQLPSRRGKCRTREALAHPLGDCLENHLAERMQSRDFAEHDGGGERPT
jgi:hypothetical protein